MAKEIRAKKKCCKTRPRCKRCPVVLKRLERKGVAERIDDRTYLMRSKPSKKQLRKVRA